MGVPTTQCRCVAHNIERPTEPEILFFRESPLDVLWLFLHISLISYWISTIHHLKMSEILLRIYNSCVVTACLLGGRGTVMMIGDGKFERGSYEKSFAIL